MMIIHTSTWNKFFIIYSFIILSCSATLKNVRNLAGAAASLPRSEITGCWCSGRGALTLSLHRAYLYLFLPHYFSLFFPSCLLKDISLPLWYISRHTRNNRLLLLFAAILLHCVKKKVDSALYLKLIY